MKGLRLVDQGIDGIEVVVRYRMVVVEVGEVGRMERGRLSGEVED